ncbi:hypothetical protein PoB_003972900 [Plakobranchus ocellatus]|uniref:Uncharacterized protein n=1 Tax=Plakobranchus ocellatus TaxID=259542 RepID=A0AAV4B3I8_9GAST|nr:hypothetical protein PoB_003972900 [Plakobranchus ocellatus]
MTICCFDCKGNSIAITRCSFGLFDSHVISAITSTLSVRRVRHWCDTVSQRRARRSVLLSSRLQRAACYCEASAKSMHFIDNNPITMSFYHHKGVNILRSHTTLDHGEPDAVGWLEAAGKISSDFRAIFLTDMPLKFPKDIN